jgi:hypothetical protein
MADPAKRGNQAPNQQVFPYPTLASVNMGKDIATSNYGPGRANYDFAAAKKFPLRTERLHLQFRADFFNVFNHTNFSNPVSSQSNANFGKITSTVGSAVATAVGTTAGLVGGGPRVIQFSLRLQF